LFRFVSTPGDTDAGRTGAALDLRGVEPGRGAYAHRNAACVERALNRSVLARALRTGVTVQEVSRLREQVEQELDTA
jgi:predicted RNA-binding protein YlxR (DUF448 family)